MAGLPGHDLGTVAEKPDREQPLRLLKRPIFPDRLRIAGIGKHQVQRQIMSGQPILIGLEHLVGRRQQAHATVLFCGAGFEKTGVDQPRHQVLDPARARQPELRHLRFQQANGRPGRPIGFIISGIEAYHDGEDDGPRGLQHQPRQESIAFIKLEHCVDIGAYARSGSADGPGCPGSSDRQYRQMGSRGLASDNLAAGSMEPQTPPQASIRACIGPGNSIKGIFAPS